MMAPPTTLDRDTLIAAITTFWKVRNHASSTRFARRSAATSTLPARMRSSLLSSGWPRTEATGVTTRQIRWQGAFTILTRRQDPAAGLWLFGMEHLAELGDAQVVDLFEPSVVLDANCLEVLLHRAGSPLADKLTAIAGPKVYSSLKRRFSSLCFGTIKTPQSSALSTEDAVMNPREVARAARRSIEAAHERLRAGDALLVFAEGTRSRTYGLQPMLAGATRYLDGPDTYVLPVGITGTEALFPGGRRDAPFSPDRWANRASDQGQRAPRARRRRSAGHDGYHRSRHRGAAAARIPRRIWR